MCALSLILNTLPWGTNDSSTTIVPVLFHVCVSQIPGLLVVPPIAVLLAKSPLVDKYQLTSLKELVVVAAPLGRDTEDQLIARFPGLQIRQGSDSASKHLYWL